MKKMSFTSTQEANGGRSWVKVYRCNYCGGYSTRLSTVQKHQLYKHFLSFWRNGGYKISTSKAWV